MSRGKFRRLPKVLADMLGQILNRRRYGLKSLLAGVALAGFWQLHKRLVRVPLVIETWKGALFLLETNSITSSRFVYELRPDERFVEILAAFAAADVLFVDVGANVGLYTVLLCRTFRRGILFEPNPIAAAMARRNLGLNGVSDGFRLIEAAVGREAGRVMVPKVTTPDPALKVGAASGPDLLSVPMVTLDSVIPPEAVVVKIDAEGYDADVIEGFAAAFASRSVRACLFECNDDIVFSRVLAAVAPNGYAVMDGPRQLDDVGAPRGRDLFIVRDDLMSTYMRACHAFQNKRGTWATS